MKETRRSLLTSCIALFLCFSMLLGSTFAWFTDVVTSAGNKIVTGNLDLDLQLKDKDTGSYSSINESSDPLFNYDKWEPGYTDIKVLKVLNAGSLSFKWVGNFVSRETITALAEVIDVYVKTSKTDFDYPAEMDEITSANGWKNIGTLDEIIDSTTQPVSGQLLSGESDYFAVALHMQEDAGNEYQDTSLGAFDIAVHAAQYTAENDSFGNDYDQNAKWPDGVISGTITASGAVTTDDQGKVANPVTLTSSDRKVTTVVPAGTQLEEGVKNVTVIVSPVYESQANVTLSDTEKMLPVDVHIDGVAKNNDVVIPVYLAEWLEVGLNIGNYHLYHVENGATNEMTLRQDGATAVHNNFDYDPATGDVTLYLKSFSEVAMVADTTKAWAGNRDYSWYNADATELTIANADQLAAFGAIVGGMAKDENGNFLINYTDSDGDPHHNDFFEGKTVKLLADINLGDAEAENNPDLIFYPIGYWNSDETYEKTGTAISSGFYAFKGTFDGNGNTISNFYQNTWEMKGDHDWYDATLQYYRDGMGLFGRILGGTVKNLTVDNFSCDSEIGTSGVIAAYADSTDKNPAIFENITITNCNPRVYNIGNGGIVGCAGWYSRNNSLGNNDYTNAVTFRNITVDQTNKISALWGSWGVSCAGILGQYYPNSNCGIKLENCHVAAIIDVNNDVCSNYQYYWYRYAGMFIGTIRANTTDANGYTVANTTGVTAKDCTYTMGDWNEYWYCEIVANSLASYTHDHQFSRLDNITSLSEIQNADGTWKKEGHFALLSADRKNVECYHIFKDSEGKLYQHFHDVADESNPNIYESFDLNGDGELNDLKEDRQRYFIPFNQLLTGLDMGIKAHTEFEGITEKKDGTVESKKKFESIGVTNIDENATVTLDKLFSSQYDASVISMPTVQVYVSPMGYGSTVSAKYNQNVNDWTQSTLTFSGKGSAKIVITDYFYCTSTTLYVTVGGVVTSYEKFETKFTGDFLYRVGNLNTVALGSLFKAKDGVNIGDVSVTVDTITGASGTYTPNATWTNGTIEFNGTGVVKVTITDNNYCTPTELYLEVVDAVNATGATNATANNVVLLNDIGSGFTVSGEYTFFGNGFTLNYTGNGQYLNNGLKQGIVTVKEKGTLDNLRVVASIYPTSYMFYEDESKKGPYEEGPNGNRYYYQLSGIAASGNATISNCYIYGARTNIFVDTGNVTINDTVLECGTLANIQIQSTNEFTVTLNNITTIQKWVQATVGDTTKEMLGTGVIVGPDISSNPNIVLNGHFKQYNWVNEDDYDKMPNGTAKAIIDVALKTAKVNHTVNGKKASNMGIIFLNNYEDEPVKNNTGLPYDYVTATLMGETGMVYSLVGANENQIYSDVANADRSTINGDYLPTFDFNLGNQEISYDGSEDARYLYGDANGVTALYKDGDNPITLDLIKLATIYKYDGMNYAVTAVCKNSSGEVLTANNGVVTLDAQGNYTIVFTVNDSIFYNQNGETITKSVERTYSVPLSLTVKEASIKNAVVNITKTALDGEYNTVNLTDYELRIKFLDCISITDYDNKGTGTTVNLSSNIASATLTPSAVNVFTTASTITITYTDGRVLTVNLSKISGSSPGTKTAKVNTSGGVYFTTEGALNNKPTEASSQNKCIITSVSYKGNSGSTVTNDTDVTVTWELGSSGGASPCVTPDTLVTLADGTQKRIDAVTYEDQLLVWDFYNGKYAVAPAAIIFNHGYADNTIIKLSFSDGTVVKVANLHQFYDNDLNKFVSIDADSVAQYVGHSFAKQSSDGYTTATLDGYEISVEYEAAYGIISAYHYNIIVEGMISTDFMLEDYDLFNYFELGENMTFDEEQMKADIEKYGLYTYEDFADYLTYEQFVGFNVQYFKIAVGKGNYTYEGILELIATYLNK